LHTTYDKIKTTLTLLVLAVTILGLTSTFALAEADVEKEYKEGLYQREQGNIYSSIEARPSTAF